ATHSTDGLTSASYSRANMRAGRRVGFRILLPLAIKTPVLAAGPLKSLLFARAAAVVCAERAISRCSLNQSSECEGAVPVFPTRARLTELYATAEYHFCRRRW